MTLAGIFTRGVVYTSRRSFALHGWSPTAPGFVDFQTGHQLAVAGGISYIACAGVATPAIRSLLEDAGFPVAAELHLYRNRGEYEHLLRRLTNAGATIAVQRVHPTDEVPDDAALVPHTVLEDLNNKGRMADLVPSDWLPARRVMAPSSLPPPEALLANGPVVLKAATARPNGGGLGVCICRASADVERARTTLACERAIVVEEFLAIERSVCVHGCVLPNGAVILTGAAEQVCDAERYAGNWLDDESERTGADVDHVVTAIAERAAERGYRGIFGVDVAFVADGPPRIIDLNFRVNGSTAAVWLRPRLVAERGARVMRLRNWTAGNFDELATIAGRAAGRGIMIPLGFYDPSACDMGGAPLVHGLVAGESREAVEGHVSELAREGLV